MLPKQKKMDSAKKSRRGGVAKSAVKSKVTHVKKTARKIVDGARGQRNDEAKNLLEQQATVVESPRRGGRRGGIATATAKPFSAKKASSPRKRVSLK